MTDPERTSARHRALNRLLTRLAGADDSPAVATVTCNLVQHLSDELTPIIGSEGMAAVFGRTVHLVRHQVVWLPRAPGEVTLASLRAALERQEPTLATDAAVLLLTTMCDLLTALVGERLTSDLLDSAWA